MIPGGYVAPGYMPCIKSVGQQLSPPDTFGRTNNVDVTHTLKEREGRYGKYEETARLAQALKDVMRSADNWPTLERRGALTASQCESLEMIANKLARILNGDPDYSDSWHDIAGYAKLIEKQLNGEEV